MTTMELFLAALVVVMAAPVIAWRLIGLERTVPLVVVQIGMGVLLGPGVLGAAFPVMHSGLFTPEVIASLDAIARWGVMLFVFCAGLELDLSSAWQERRDTATTAGLALAVPMLAGCAAAALMLQWPGWIGAQGSFAQVMFGIGMACAVTALPILVLLLEQLDLFNRPLGQRVLRYASLDDLTIWAVLALIVLDWQRLGLQLLFLTVFAAMTFLIRGFASRLSSQDFWLLAPAWVAACGLGADWSGLHFMVGAFLAGAVLDRNWFGEDRLAQMRQFLLLTVMPVFFLSTGLRTQWGEMGQGGVLAVLGAAALLLAVSVGGKLAGLHLAGRILGWDKGEARTIGWLLQTKALIMIIFAQILLDREIVTAQTFTALLLMAVASTALTMPMLARRL